MADQQQSYQIWGITLLLGVVAVLRIRYLPQLTDMTVDEVWSVWQSSVGGPQAIVARTPFDWPPGYYLLLGGWQALVGSYPLVLRWLMLLFALLGGAAVYRVGRGVFGSYAAGALALLVYSVSGWSIYVSLHLRGHSLVYALAPVVMWITLRYMRCPRWWVGVLLGLSLAALFYVHVTVVVFFAALGLLTLVWYGWRAVYRWLLPGAVLLFVSLPELNHKWRLINQSRQTVAEQNATQPVWVGLWDYLDKIARQGPVLWAVLLAVGLVLLAWGGRSTPRRLAGLLLWVAFPLVLMLPLLVDLFDIRYTSWYLSGLAVAVGGGLAGLPRPAYWLMVPLLVGYGLLPMEIRDYDSFPPEFGLVLHDLSRVIQPGDVVIMDPDLERHGLEEWDYFSQVYFPQGLQQVTTPDDHRRVWYLRDMKHETRPLREAIVDGRAERRFFGPPTLFLQLYEQPPDPTGILFENGLRFHGADVLRPDGSYNHTVQKVFREQQAVRVRLWWTVDAPLEMDYSLGLHILSEAGHLHSSDDTPTPVSLRPDQPPPPAATSQWEPGRFYVTEHTVTTRADSHVLGLVVYQWWDDVRVPAAATNADGLLPLLTFDVKAW